MLRLCINTAQAIIYDWPTSRPLIPARMLIELEQKTDSMHIYTYEEEDTCMSYEEEDTCMSHEEEDICMSYEEEQVHAHVHLVQDACSKRV